MKRDTGKPRTGYRRCREHPDGTDCLEEEETAHGARQLAPFTGAVGYE